MVLHQLSNTTFDTNMNNCTINIQSRFILTEQLCNLLNRHYNRHVIADIFKSILFRVDKSPVSLLLCLRNISVNEQNQQEVE